MKVKTLKKIFSISGVLTVISLVWFVFISVILLTDDENFRELGMLIIFLMSAVPLFFAVVTAIIYVLYKSKKIEQSKKDIIRQ